MSSTHNSIRRMKASANPPPDSYEHARKFGYDESFHVIKFLLKECEIAKNEDDRSKITEKLFNYLIQNPAILIYQPIFRRAVIGKMIELELYIQKRVQRFNHAKYGEAIHMMNTASDVFISNKNVRDRIRIQLKELSGTLENYRQWAGESTLMSSFDGLKMTLNSIKNDPNYVSGKDANRSH